MAPQNTIFFDIETGGFSGANNPILSISWANNNEEVVSQYSKLQPGHKISKWSENKIWEPIKSRGHTLIQEQHLLMNFLSQLENAPEGTRLVGWNIGYVAAAQSRTRAAGFDVQMIIERAKQMGMEERARKAFQRHQLVDIGAEWAWKIARGLAGTTGQQLVEEGVIHPTLREQAIGFVKKGSEYASKYGLTTHEEIAESLSRHNRWFSGWKQELVYEVITGEPLKEAHASEADVRALRQILNTSQEVDEQFLRRWGPLALRNKLVGQAKFVHPELAERTPARFQSIMEEAQRWGMKADVEAELKKMASLSGVDYSEIMAGRGIRLRERVVREGIADKLSIAGAGELAGVVEDILPFMKKHGGKLAVAGILGAGLLLQPGQWFSGKDDEYNVLEGLKHGGEAQRMRRAMTDFGSGWIRKALSRGIDPLIVGAAAEELGKKGMQLISTKEGGQWLVGKKLGKGGFGVVSEAFEVGTGKAGIFKQVGKAQPLKEGQGILSPAFARELEKHGGEFWESYVSPASEALRRTSTEYGGLGAAHEAAMQRIAREKFGKAVPEVFGTTPTGIFMESAGKPLTKEQEMEGMQWLQKQWSKHMREVPKLGQKTVYHLDPQVKNLMIKGKEFQLIDWGVATTETLPTPVIKRAEKAFQSYVTRFIPKAELPNTNVQRLLMNTGTSTAAPMVGTLPVPQPPRLDIPRMPLGNIPDPIEKTKRLLEAPEGLPEKTVAARMRKKNTDFDSPVNLNKTVSRSVSELPKVATKINPSIMKDLTRKSKASFQRKHKESQVRASQNSLRPGKRHRGSAGKVIT